MILYNITYNIDAASDTEWRQWLKDYYLPGVMTTGCFNRYKVYRLLQTSEREGINYAVQFFSESLEDLNQFLEHYAPPLTAALQEKFRHRHVAFMSVLQDTEM